MQEDSTNVADWLQTPAAIRERCALIHALAERDELAHFALVPERLDATAELVLETTRSAYPSLTIPYHARWRHFSTGGVDRWAGLSAKLNLPPDELARFAIDLVITSVLLDAGAGAQWSYTEPGTGSTYVRSEGLAVASFHAFTAGTFSAIPDHEPLRADASALAEMSEQTLARAFQVRSDNPLVGLCGRAQLLRRLGAALEQQPARFGDTNPRVGNLYDTLSRLAHNGRLPAAVILAEVLRAFGSIWPNTTVFEGRSLGDVWPHSAIPEDGLIPFHKLSQWLTYSLVEPLERAGLEIVDLDALTGLPEYRNGGLFVDTGVLRPKNAELLRLPQAVTSEPIVEWRALTVILLDQLADCIRERLDMDAHELPLAKVLEGGSWSAGRRIAAQLRPGGAPPIQLNSDGTVF